MIPDWITWEHGKDLVLLGLFIWTHRSNSNRFSNQDKVLKKQSLGQEWNNEVTELLVEAAKVKEKVPSTPIPPRPKVDTLTDPFESLVAQARALDESRKK